MGNRVFGCDDCLAVCPWNKFAAAAREARFAARAETDNPPLAELLQLDDARFPRALCRHAGQAHRAATVSAQRADRRRQLGRRDLLPRVETLLGDASPLVRAMAVWAMRQLTGTASVSASPPASCARRRQRRARRVAGDEPRHEPTVLLRARLQRAAFARRLAAQGWRIAGTARTPEGAAAIAAQGYEAFVFDGTAPSAGVAQALASGNARPRLGAARCRRRSRAAPPRRAISHGARRCAGSATCRPSASMATSDGAWVDETTPTQADLAARDAGASRQRRSGWRLATACGSPSRLSPRRHLRSGPQRHRPAARGHGAAHRQAGSGVQPHPRRRHRRACCAAMPARRGTRSTTSPTTSRRRRRTSSPTPPSCCTCRRRRRSPSRTPSSRPMAASFYADNKRIRNTRLRQELGVVLKFPTYREGLRAILAGSCTAEQFSTPATPSHRSAAVQAAPALLAKSSRAFAATFGSAPVPNERCLQRTLCGQQ